MLGVLGIDDVALDPGAEELVFERHVVLGLAGANALAAADAAFDVDDHRPPVRSVIV
ncbi:MAG: hypothetical protein U0Q11_01360 [Vicinamibacterales bacterium]